MWLCDRSLLCIVYFRSCYSFIECSSLLLQLEIARRTFSEIFCSPNFGQDFLKVKFSWMVAPFLTISRLSEVCPSRWLYVSYTQGVVTTFGSRFRFLSNVGYNLHDCSLKCFPYYSRQRLLELSRDFLGCTVGTRLVLRLRASSHNSS